MTTQIRVFTVEVTGCRDCPSFADEFGACFWHQPSSGFGDEKQRKLVSDNYAVITPSCPMHGQSFLKDETK